MILVCASANPDKVAEIEQLLAGAVDLRPRPVGIPDVDENLDTLVGNAWLKAKAICDATGLPAVADDTGLFVDALEGRPGVHTARYAGENATYADNRAKMLHEIHGVPWELRTASFRTVALVVFPDRQPLAVEGVCPGHIATEEHDGRGFGYDPIFMPAGSGGRVFSQMTDNEKNAVSHRGRAFRQLLRALELPAS